MSHSTPRILAYGSLIAVLSLTGTLIVAGLASTDHRVQKSAGVVVGVAALAASCLVMFIFGGSDADPTNYNELVWGVALAPALFLGATTVAIARHHDWRAPAVSILVMVALTALSFMVWLELDIVTAAPRISSIVLAALTGLVLIGYLKRQEQPG